MREKMKISDRAKIFAPFDALKGFREALNDKEEINEEKLELSNEMEEELSFVFNQIKIGNMLKIKYYNINKYVVKEGILTKIDLDNRLITIVKEKIKIDDICYMEILEEKGI